MGDLRTEQVLHLLSTILIAAGNLSKILFVDKFFNLCVLPPIGIKHFLVRGDVAFQIRSRIGTLHCVTLFEFPPSHVCLHVSSHAPNLQKRALWIISSTGSNETKDTFSRRFV